MRRTVDAILSFHKDELGLFVLLQIDLKRLWAYIILGAGQSGLGHRWQGEATDAGRKNLWKVVIKESDQLVVVRIADAVLCSINLQRPES